VQVLDGITNAPAGFQCGAEGTHVGPSRAKVMVLGFEQSTVGWIRMRMARFRAIRGWKMSWYIRRGSQVDGGPKWLDGNFQPGADGGDSSPKPTLTLSDQP